MTKPGVDFPARVRNLILIRDLSRCVVCGRFMPDGGNAHHRKLRSQGGMGTVENGILVCGTGTTGCHGRIHAEVEKARTAGLLVPSWEDPAGVVIVTWRGRLIHDRDGGVEVLP